MNPTPALNRGRRLAAKLLPEHAHVTRAPKPALDVHTGATEPGGEMVVYDGPAGVDVLTGGDKTVAVGNASVLVETSTLKIPYHSPRLQAGDRVTFTSDDPTLDGNRYRVSGTRPQSHALTHHYQLEQVHA